MLTIKVLCLSLYFNRCFCWLSAGGIFTHYMHNGTFLWQCLYNVMCVVLNIVWPWSMRGQVCCCVTLQKTKGMRDGKDPANEHYLLCMKCLLDAILETSIVAVVVVLVCSTTKSHDPPLLLGGLFLVVSPSSHYHGQKLKLMLIRCTSSIKKPCGWWYRCYILSLW